MIKLLLSGQRNILFTIIAWSLLVFVGYNILTVEATSEKDIKNYDYDSYEEYNEIIEPLCNDKGGKLNHGDGYCYFDERDKELQFEKELDDKGLGHDYTAEEEASWNQKTEAEKAAKEDALCDNEDADTTNIELCKSEDRKNNQQKNEREWYYNENTNQYEYLSDEEIKEHNMEAESEIMQGEKWGPETPIEPPSEPYPTTEEEVIEDYSNTVTPDTNNDNEITPEEAESYVASISDEEQNEEEVADNNEDDNQVNTDAEDSSDNTDSSDSQDSSESEDDGGDSSDSGDDSSSSDDGWDSGDSSESEE